MPKKYSDSDVRERTGDDSKVLAALDDLINAVHIYGVEKVSGQTLMDVIAMRLESYELEEVEVEAVGDPWEAA